MRNLMWIALIVAVAASAARADGILKVASDVPAQVTLDDQAMGETPLTIQGLKGGNHQLAVTNAATKETKSVMVFIPASLTVAKDVDVTFQPPAAPEVAAAPAVVAAPAAAPVVVAAPVHHHNDHVRRRNVALGVTAVGVLTHSHILTGIGLGGALMNEVIGSGR